MSAAEGFEEFVAIIDAGSLTAAAQELGLPRPTLSRRLARLEERLGVKLIHRTTRRLTPTTEGEVLYEKARRVVLIAKDAEAEIKRLDGVPRGLLRVSVPPGMPPAMLAKWLVDYMDDYPEVQLELVATNEHVHMVEDGFDVALRAGSSRDDSLIEHTINRSVLVAVATPEYISQHGAPQNAAQLGQHNCILGYLHGVTPQHKWPLLDGGTVAVTGRLRANQMGLRIQAALLHTGIALALQSSAEHLLAEGALVHILPDIIGQQQRVCLVYPDRAFLDPKVRTFVDFVASRIQSVREEA